MRPFAVVGRQFLAVAVGAMLTLSGCVAPPTSTAPLSRITNIKINGVDYATPAAALEAKRQANQRTLDTFAKSPEPIKGRARVVVPDRDRLRPLVAQELQQQLKRPVAGDLLEFEVASRQLDLRTFADALDKAGAFETVEVVEQNDVRNPDLGTMDYLVWYQVRTTLPDYTGPWLGHWLVRRSGSVATGSVGIDPGAPAGTVRAVSFVNNVREAAQRLSGTSVAAAGQARAAGQDGGVASGFVVDAHGTVVTNEHVVRVCPELRVIDAAHQTYGATIVATDAANDLALLKSTHHWPDAAVFHDGHESRPGDAVVVTGYPLSGIVGSGMAVATGSITASTGPRDDSRLLQVSAPVQLGNSGGPVLDGSGRVIGVVTGTLNGMVLAVLTGAVPQNVNFAVKASVVRNFLETHDVAFAHAGSGHELAAGDVGDLARKFTMRVDCRKR
jgi:S1-C subfamily serine protease